MNEATANAVDTLLSTSALHNDANFLRAVTQMADSQAVVTGAAIFAENGAKLLEKGVRIDSRLYERLLQHRLSAAIDDHLLTQDAVDLAALERQVHHLAETTQLGQHLAQSLGTKFQSMLEAVRYLKWPPQASFKLTVMRHQLPELYEHSVLMMMVAVFLAIKDKLPLHDCANLAAAALLHDVGMLYMPPSWVDPQHKLTAEERKQLAAHSITAMLVVRSAKVFPRDVEIAVLEHHERLDGSGYPRHIRAEDISAWGRILMLAEVVSAFYSKYSDMPAQRLSLVLRMNHNRFDATLLQHIYTLLAESMAQPMDRGTHTSAEARTVIATLGAVFQHWASCKRKFPEKWHAMNHGRAALYVDSRMLALEKSLAESGSHPRQQANWLAMFDEDPASVSEVVLINKEALWQVENCVETCVRRWPQLLQPGTELEDALHDWLSNCRSVLAAAQGKPVGAAGADAATAVASSAAPPDLRPTADQTPV